MIPESSPPDDSIADEVVARVSGVRGVNATELLPLVYDQLRTLARTRLALLAPGQTLQATALVHEAWLKLVENGDPGWDGRAHFFGAAARAMRLILVDDARRKGAVRHGGERKRVPLDDLPVFELDAPAEEILALDAALERLAAIDPEKANIVMLRFFCGLTLPEVGDILGRGLTTVEKKWRFARAWLRTEMAEDRERVRAR